MKVIHVVGLFCAEFIEFRHIFTLRKKYEIFVGNIISRIQI